MSLYPDGTTQFQVTINPPICIGTVRDSKVRRITCHRLNRIKGQEEYLVEWRGLPNRYSYSWHTVPELANSLRKVQRYLLILYDQREREAQQKRLPLPPSSGFKRKSPSATGASPTPSSSSASSQQSISGLSIFAPSYNGTVKREDGIITIIPWPADQCFPEKIPTPQMEAHALNPRHLTNKAEYEIRKVFSAKLAQLPDPPIMLDPASTGAPLLNFEFVEQSILREGVHKLDPETIVGCGHVRYGQVVCSPHMGQGVGCEYSRICDCLELAPVDKKRLTKEQRELFEAGELMGIPKRFPYGAPSSKNAYCLVDFYLDKRHTIYECNEKCKCGPQCKTRVVQKGRKLPLEIFKTKNRGWGLRCPAPLQKGEFIDTYRGEIITVSEAEKRETKTSGRAKASYFYDLDKHMFDENGEKVSDDHYVVDGEYFGGPTRFMNHSCEPNCGQYVLSLNKHDQKVYELAFFALEDIPAFTELTFDYLDKEEEDESMEVKEEGGIPCFCGAKKCRKWLWR